MRKKVTLKQLAKELNLSISTVSKSLKNDAEISKKTIQRVNELASFYNYKPNPLAVSLKSNKTMTIGIVLPDILNHFFAKVLYGIELEASKRGYKIVTCITNESFEKEVGYVEMLNFSSVDGFIISLSQETQVVKKYDHLLELQKDQVPIVMFDRVTSDINCDKVIVDDKEASRKAIEYLIKTGSKKIAIITTIGELSVAKLRLQGAKDAVRNTTVSLLELSVESNANFEIEIQNFLKSHDIDAVLGLDETAAAITINMGHKLGIKIPEDIAVIGFTDGLLSRYAYPKLTTVSQHAEDIGARTVQVLVDQIESTADSYTAKTEVLKTSLIFRDSTN